jgi:hypothetical protein
LHFQRKAAGSSAGEWTKGSRGPRGGDGLLRVPSACAERGKWREGVSGPILA